VDIGKRGDWHGKGMRGKFVKKKREKGLGLGWKRSDIMI
jgi:hypothetical protein